MKNRIFALCKSKMSEYNKVEKTRKRYCSTYNKSVNQGLDSTAIKEHTITEEQGNQVRWTTISMCVCACVCDCSDCHSECFATFFLSIFRPVITVLGHHILRKKMRERSDVTAPLMDNSE